MSPANTTRPAHKQTRGTRGTRQRESRDEDRRLAVRLTLTLLADDDNGPASSLPEIVDLIGADKALLLVMALGGSVIRIPTFMRIVDALEEAQAAVALLHGRDTSRVIAARNGLSEKRLLRVYGKLLENRRAMRESARKLDAADDSRFISSMFEQHSNAGHG